MKRQSFGTISVPDFAISTRHCYSFINFLQIVRPRHPHQRIKLSLIRRVFVACIFMSLNTQLVRSLIKTIARRDKSWLNHIQSRRPRDGEPHASQPQLIKVALGQTSNVWRPLNDTRLANTSPRIVASSFRAKTLRYFHWAPFSPPHSFARPASRTWQILLWNLFITRMCIWCRVEPEYVPASDTCGRSVCRFGKAPCVTS